MKKKSNLFRAIRIVMAAMLAAAAVFPPSFFRPGFLGAGSAAAADDVAIAVSEALITPQNIFRSSDGNLIAIYQDSGGLYFKASANSGASWGSAQTITYCDPYTEYQTSSVIGPDNAVHVIFYETRCAPGIYSAELSYSAGSWTAGSVHETGAPVYPVYLPEPDVVLTSDGTLWMVSVYATTSSFSEINIATSTDSGATWSAGYRLATSANRIDAAARIAAYNDRPIVVYSYNATDAYLSSISFNGGGWDAPIPMGYIHPNSPIAKPVVVGSELHVVRGNEGSESLVHQIFDGESWTDPVAVNAAADVYNPAITTDGTNVWLLYSHSGGTANNFDIRYKKYRGATGAWDASGTALTASGSNNVVPVAPFTIASGGLLPYMFSSGSSDPFSLNFNSLATSVAAPVISAISAVPSGGVSAEISWTTDLPATSQVEYGLTSAYTASSTLGAPLVTSHTVNISGLVPETEYHYRVLSISGEAMAASSTDQTFTTDAAPPDGTAPSVEIISPRMGAYASGTAFSLTASSTDNIAIAGVKFFADDSIAVGSEDIQAPYAASWNTVAAGDGDHSLIAVARDLAGNIATSSPITVTVDNTAPSISSVSAGTPNGSGATVTWTTNEPSTSRVEYGLTSSYGSLSPLSSSTSTGHSVPLSGLATSTTYHYRVVSLDSAGNTARSSDATFLTTDGLNDVPQTPTALSAVPVSDSEINLAWERTGTMETAVTIWRSLDNASFSPVISLPARSNIYTDGSLYPSTLYYYRITADSIAGSSTPTSAVATSTQGVMGGLSSATGFSAAAASPYAVTLSWTDPIAGYHSWIIQRSENGMLFQTIATTEGSSYADSPLSPATTYYYRIRAVSGSDQGPYASPAQATTQSLAGLPSVPSGLAAVVQSATNASLSWTDANAGGATYLIERSPYYTTDNQAVWTELGETSAGAADYSFTASAETSYYVRIRAKNGSGNSAYTDPVIVRMASAGTGSPKIYEIGPGKTYASLGDLDWTALGPGDRVNVYPNRDAEGSAIPYYERPMISVRGTAAAPIIIRGIPDPSTGELPVIDGTDAVLETQWQNHYAPINGFGILIFGTRADNNRGGWSPGYVTVENFEIRNGSSGGIYIEKGDHVSIIGNAIHDNNGTGIFGAGQGDARNLEEILIDSNYVYENGVVGSYLEHETYLEGINVTYQFNKYLPLRSGALGGGLKDRGAGTIIRYNWISGGARLIDLVESQNYFGTVMAMPSYHASYVYGNALYNGMPGGSGMAIHYGGDQGVNPVYRKGILYFYNNTYSTHSNQSDSWRVNIFDLTSGGGNLDARNNILLSRPSTTGQTPSDNNLITSAGAAYFGPNWVSPGWNISQEGYAAQAAGTDNFINNVSNDPGFVDFTAQDFHLTGGAQALDGSEPIPANAPAVQSQYREPYSSQARSVAGSSFDLGAFEYGIAATDEIAPSFSNISAGTPGQTGATITWNTNEAATSQVEYGPTSGYGLFSALDSQLETSHIAVLSSLGENTLYHFRVASRDSSGNAATSTDHTFTTAAAPASTHTITAAAGAHGTIAPSGSVSVADGENQSFAISPDSGYSVATLTVDGTGMATSTAYLFSNVTSDHTISVTFSQNPSQDPPPSGGGGGGGGGGGASYFYPVITQFGTAVLSQTSFVVSWLTDVVSDSTVEYGTTTSYGLSANGTSATTTHQVILTGLEPQTLYHIRALSRSLSGSVTASPDYTVTTGSDSSPGGSGASPSVISLRLIESGGTFFLIQDGMRYGITGPGILNSYGFTFADAKAAAAEDLAAPMAGLLSPADGALVKTQDSPSVYLISDQMRHEFTSAAVFKALGFSFGQVLTVTAPELNVLPLGGIISDAQSRHLRGSNIIHEGTVYYLGSGTRYPYPSLEVYNSWNLKDDFSRVVPANAADLLLPEGSAVEPRILQ